MMIFYDSCSNFDTVIWGAKHFFGIHWYGPFKKHWNIQLHPKATHDENKYIEVCV